MKHLVTLLLITACLAREEAQDKALSGGRDKTAAELEEDKKKLAKQQKQERNEAKKTFNKRCGSILKEAKWKADEANDGFFVYRTKSLACDDEQLVLIDVDAAHHMNSHYTSCTKSDDKRLLLEIPKSPVATNRQIRVDCQTKVLDIGFDDGKLQIATIERNGSTHRATIDQDGQWHGEITEIAKGISTFELNALHKQAKNSVVRERWDVRLRRWLKARSKGQ